MADVRVGSPVQATAALGQKLVSLLQTLIELNPGSQRDLKDLHYDIEVTSGTLRQLQDLMVLDGAVAPGQNTRPSVTPAYLDEIEGLAVKCGLIYKAIMLITQKAGARERSKEGSAQPPGVENLKAELLTGPVPDPGSIKSIKLVRIPAKLHQQQWLEPRFDRCQEQLQWIRTGLLIHLHIFKLARLQNGSAQRNPGDFENEFIHRSSIHLLRRRQAKFTKKKSAKQEKAQRKWELERKADGSDAASVTSVASSGRSSVTASTAVDDQAPAKGQAPVAKGVGADVVGAGKVVGPMATKGLGQVSATDVEKGQNEQSGGAKVTEADARGDKSKALRPLSLGALSRIGTDLPAYLFDWKQRIFGTDDRFRTDWPSTDLEAYIRHNPSFAKPTKVPFGHKRLHYGLNKVIRDGQRGGSTWNRYVQLGQVVRLAIDDIVEEANRNQSRERVCVAFQEYSAASDDPFILVFLSLRKEPQPLSFTDAVGRNYTIPFETCRKWEAMRGTIIEAFNHVQVIGPRVIEGHFDLLSSDGHVILPHLWETTVKPGAAVSMRMWPTTPLRGFYGAPPFVANPRAPNSWTQAMHLAMMRQMQQQQRMAMSQPPRPPRRVPMADWRRPRYEVSEEEDAQLTFVDFAGELEGIRGATVAELLRRFTALEHVADEDPLGEFLDADSDYDSDGTTSTSSSTEIIND